MTMKLSQWAKKLGISYRTAWRMYKNGQIPNAVKLPTGSIIVLEDECENKSIVEENNTVAIYCRVSDNASKDNLERQAEKLKEYAIARGYQIKHIVKEIGSGVNDSRPKLMKLLNQSDYNILLIEHKDKLTICGFNYIKSWLESTGRKIEIANEADDDKTDLMQDLVSIIYSFSARLYGLRRAKKKAEELVKIIQSDE
ncbi:MAG: IS607 family transposase [Hydrogenobaculum sp.]